MNAPNWGLIRSGGTFEALVTTLVGFMDPTAPLFGRPGKDGGQDVKSSDGRTVFQAKFNKSESASVAMASAKDEASKIKEYKEVNHSNYTLWKDVTNYVFVTNAQFNANDDLKWKNEVTPLFDALGLASEYWSQSRLTALVSQYPDVSRAFFESENRVFLSLQEVAERADIFILPRTLHLATLSRQADLQLFEDFSASDAQWLAVSGPGGIGKSRFLYESGIIQSRVSGWQVLWANTATMDTARWFEAVSRERETLLLVDEPEEHLLKQLLEQIHSLGLTKKKWKLVVSARNSRDPVLQFLRSTKMKGQVRFLQLEPLSFDNAEACARNLLDSGPLSESADAWKEQVSKQIARIADRFPGYVTLCVQALESGQMQTKVPESLSDYAREYIAEYLSLPDLKIEHLRWLALLSPLNREDQNGLSAYCQGSGVDSQAAALQLLQRLARLGIAFARGARQRLLEIKPDVLRDTLLMDWLAFSPGFGDKDWHLTADAHLLIQDIITAYKDGQVSGPAQAKLMALARVDFLLARPNSSPGLLSSFFTVLYSAFPHLSTVTKEAVLKALIDVAPVCPDQIIEFSRLTRLQPAPVQEYELLGHRFTATQYDLNAASCQLLVSASRLTMDSSSKQAILEELFEYLGLPQKDFSRALRQHTAVDALRHIVEGGREFRSDFLLAIYAFCSEKLRDVLQSPSPTHIRAVSGLLKISLTSEFHPTWFDGRLMHSNRVFVGSVAELAAAQHKLRDEIWNHLEDRDATVELRLCLWEALSDSHRQFSSFSAGGNSELLDLQRALKVLEERTLEVEELRSARKLWVWHLKGDRDQERMAVAEKLEASFLANPLAQEFERFLSRDHANNLKLARERISELSKNDDIHTIRTFFENALVFLGEPTDRRKIYRLLPLMIALGELAPENDAIKAFIRYCLTRDEDAFRLLGLESASHWVRAEFPEPNIQIETLKTLLALVEDLSTKAELALFVLRGSPAILLGAPPDAREYFRNLDVLFIGTARAANFVEVLATMLEVDFPATSATIESLIISARPDNREALLALLKSLENLPDNLENAPRIMEWFTTMTVEEGQLEAINDAERWYLEEVVRKFGPLPYPLVLRLVKRELSLSLEEGRSPSAIGPLGQLARRVDADISLKDADDAQLEEIVKLLHSNKSCSWEIIEFVRSIDPEGLLVPGFGAKLDIADDGGLYRLARLCSAYPLNSPAWRTLAMATLKKSGSAQRRREIYSSLLDSFLSYSGQPGQVPTVFQDRVGQAEKAKAEETEQLLVPFWEWYLKKVTSDLKDEEESVKEELID